MRTRRAAWSRAALLGTITLVGACVDRLPDEDLRILTAVPIAKLSADLLWKEFQENSAAARSRYFGQVVEITGIATTVGHDLPGQRVVVFGQGTNDRGIRAQLLSDRAADVLSNMPEDRRLTLRCYCERLEGDLLLKSCIRP